MVFSASAQKCGALKQRNPSGALQALFLCTRDNDSRKRMAAKPPASASHRGFASGNDRLTVRIAEYSAGPAGVRMD
jgi:hypothetical protein